MSSDNELVVKLTALGDDFQSGINSALSSWTSLLSGMSGGITVFGTVTASLFAVAEKTADFEASLEKLSERTGMTVEGLSQLKYAAEQSDTSLESLTTSIKFMGRTLTDAAAGNEKAQVSFRALGLNWQELLDMPVKDRFLAVVNAISQVEDPSLRVGLAMRVLGRNAEEMLPFINQGAAGIEALMKKAEEFGLVVTGQAGKGAHEFGQEMNTLGATLKRIGLDIGEAVMPAFKVLAEGLWAAAAAVKGGILIAFDSLRVILDGIGIGLLGMLYGLNKISDAAGITKGAAAELKIVFDRFIDVSKDGVSKLGKDLINTGTYMETVAQAIFKAHDAQEDLNTSTANGSKMTDAQRLAILNEAEAARLAAEAYRALLQENKTFNKGYVEDLNAVLEHKRAVGVYDNEYYAALSMHLALSGQTEKAIAEMIYVEKTKHGEDYLNEELTRKKKIKDYDDAYFIEFRQKAIDAGATEIEVNRLVDEEKKRIRKEELKDAHDHNELLKTIYQGLGDAVKQIWNNEGMSFKQLWKNALSNFVNIMVQMVLEAQSAADAIDVSMAEATFGISLVIGLIGIMFSSSDREDGSFQQAVNTFLSTLKNTLKQFESQILSSMDRITRMAADAGQSFKDITTDINSFVSNISVANRTGINAMSPGDMIKNMDALSVAITDRYNLEKSLIGDIMNLLRDQKNFVKDIDQSIKDVSRSGFTKEQIFAAQKSDITTLTAAMTAASGQDRVDIANELKQAYLAYFETAKGLFSGDDLIAIQNQVVAGLQDVKAAGISGYDQLIKINMDILGVQRTGNDLQQQLNTYLMNQGNALIDALNAMKAMATFLTNDPLYQSSAAGQAQLHNLLNLLSNALSGLGYNMSTLANTGTTGSTIGGTGRFATGAYVTQATKAIVGEGGEPEWVLPESKLMRFMQLSAQAQGGGGGAIVQHIDVSVTLPNIKNLNQISQVDAEQLLKTTFRRAAENLGRNGYTWGMQSSSR